MSKKHESSCLNIYNMKKEEHKVAYESDGRSLQTDYVLGRKIIQKIKDFKVVVGKCDLYSVGS